MSDKKEKQKIYREINKEKLKEASKSYWESKKEQIKERRKQIVICNICQKETTRESFYRHRKSKFCQEIKSPEIV